MTELNSTWVLRNGRGLPNGLNIAQGLSEKIIDGNLCWGDLAGWAQCQQGERQGKGPGCHCFPKTIPRLALCGVHMLGTLRKVKAVHFSSSVPSGDSISPTKQAFQISRTKSGVGICC